MEAGFIKIKYKIFFYDLKQGKNNSFYLSESLKNILTENLTFKKHKKKSGLSPAKYQIYGFYKKDDLGIYKTLNKGRIHTKIIEIIGYPTFVGWDEIYDRFNLNDLLIIYSYNNCKEPFELHFFLGLAKVNCLKDESKHLQAFIKNRSPNLSILKVA